MAPVLERGCVDATVISGRDGVGKPSATAFALMTERIGVPVEASYFIDDQLFQVEAVRALGYASFVYEGDASQARSWLRGEGLPI
jgi:HAD superfamily hydrolase (TIGR01509 family)